MVSRRTVVVGCGPLVVRKGVNRATVSWFISVGDVVPTKQQAQKGGQNTRGIRSR